MYVADEHLPLAVLERELEYVILETSPRLRTDTLAVAARAAKNAGATAVRLAALTGLSRQAIYDALKRRPTELPPDLEYVIAASVANHAETLESLAGLLGVPDQDLEPVVDRLERDGLIKSARAGDTRVLLGGDNSIPRLRSRLQARRWVRMERFSMYIRLADSEGRRIAAAAAEELGDEHFTILHKGVAHHVVTDELAFGVAASDRREAIAVADELWNRIRDRAGLTPQLMQLADVIDPARAG